MKSATVNVQIQFDIEGKDNSEVSEVGDTIDIINGILQERMPDISPIIFTQAIDDSDIYLDEYDDDNDDDDE